MNRINPNKLRLSKWTSVMPLHQEKHFLVTKVQSDEAGVPQTCTVEAVHSGREQTLAWRDLKDPEQWLMGWR